ncbi:MAG: purine/pyrimidine permease [Proteobacteria bacterium]|nr:purine/pyrimidine permease [Pseudomonadota bacterium]
MTTGLTPTEKEELSVIRYQPDEQPPLPMAFGLGFQQAALCISGMVLTPMIVIRAAGLGDDAFLLWAVFAAIAISGVTTILQARRIGRVGAGYPLLMGTSGAFIAVCVTALQQGGPALLSSLVFVSAMFQFALAARLSWVRRVITPTVAGTVIMLISVTVMPIMFDLLGDVPEDVSPAGPPLSAAVTLLVVAGLALRASGALRLWAPVIGLIAGSAVAGFFGLYDLTRVLEADWVGVPSGWPGLDVNLDARFWSLLPAFVFVTLIGAIETVGDAMGVQTVAWRRSRAIDFREVQGAVAADGVGNLLSGLAGTVPNTTYSSSIAITELTGVAARSVGVWIGVVFVVMAFMPKVAALLLAVPGPVAAAYVTVLIAMLFVLGMRMVVRDGADARKGVIVGLSFWIGVGFQNQVIFPEHLGGFWGALLGNGMTTGGLTAMALTAFLNFTSSRARRIRTDLDSAAVSPIDDFLCAYAEGRRWPEEAAERLRAAGEEALLSLLQRHAQEDDAPPPRLLLTARNDGPDAVLEFVVATGGGNLEDRLLLLSERPLQPEPNELSLRLLRLYASSVQHQQYHGTDIVIVRVNGRAVR